MLEDVVERLLRDPKQGDFDLLAGSLRSFAAVEEESGGRTRPFASQVSAARIPGPPALVSMPTRRPRGIG